MVETKEPKESIIFKRRYLEEAVAAIPLDQKEWLKGFVDSFYQDGYEIFNRHKFPRDNERDKKFFAWVSLSQAEKRDFSKIDFKAGRFNFEWSRICGHFFEKVALHYLGEKTSDLIVPGEIFPSEKIPDAFLVRKFSSCLLVIGSFEVKLGDSHWSTGKMMHQLKKMKNLEEHFQDEEFRKRLVEFAGVDRPVTVNPEGYARRFLVTHSDWMARISPGVEHIKVPLNKQQTSNLCAAALLDFQTLRQRVKILKLNPRADLRRSAGVA